MRSQAGWLAPACHSHPSPAERPPLWLQKLCRAACLLTRRSAAQVEGPLPRLAPLERSRLALVPGSPTGRSFQQAAGSLPSAWQATKPGPGG